jgi:hypothetical protein
LAQEERKATKERQKRDGTYRSGMNMEEGAVDGYTLDELLAAAAATPKKETSQAPRSQVLCPFCNKKGHKTTKSKHCLKNPNAIKAKEKTAHVDEDLISPPLPDDDDESQLPNGIAFDDASDASRMDLRPLQDDVPSDRSDVEEFFDAGTWSDSEEDEDRVI